MFNSKKIKELQEENKRLIKLLAEKESVIISKDKFFKERCFFRNSKGQIQKY